MLDTSELFSRVDELTIFKDLLNRNFELGTLIKSPFRKDTTPSFNIFKATKTPGFNYMYKDFGTGESGNCINLAARLNNQSYIEAYRYLLNKYNIQSNFNLIKENKIVNNIIKNKDYKITPNLTSWLLPNFNKHYSYEYWEKLGVNISILHFLNIFPVKSFIYESHKVSYRVEASKENFIFAYKIIYNNEVYYKIYQPFKEKGKGKFLNPRIMPYIENDCVLKDKNLIKNKTIIITKSTKDVACLLALGFASIAVSSETSYPDEAYINYLKRNYLVYLLFDNDEAGKLNAKKFKEKFSIAPIFFPSPEKDVADNILKFGKTQTKNLLIEMIQQYGKNQRSKFY